MTRQVALKHIKDMTKEGLLTVQKAASGAAYSYFAQFNNPLVKLSQDVFEFETAMCTLIQKAASQIEFRYWESPDGYTYADVAAFLVLFLASAFSLELIPFLEKSLVIESISRSSTSWSCPSVLVCFSCAAAVTTAVLFKDAAAFMRRRHVVPAFTALAFVSHSSVLKHMLVSRRWAPGEGLEPSSPEGHQLARRILCVYDNIHI